MSVINQMLQDLDRRNAMAGAEAQGGPQNLKVVEPGGKGGRDWFWRVIAGLLLIAVAWVAWVAYQLLPRPLVTDQVFAAMQRRPAPITPVQAPAPPVAMIAVQEVTPPAAAVAEPKSIEPAETFKLARAIETPIAQRKPEPSKPKAAPPKTAKSAPVTKQAITKTASDVAEAQFRRAALFLNQGRVSEAEAQLVQALKADPAHVSSRQAYAALLLEQGRVEHARQLLEQGVSANPSHAPFALALARIHVEQRDYAAALQVMDNAGAAAYSAEFQGLRAVVLQRMGRHAEAVSAYQQALRNGPQSAATWIGLGISLEALGHRPEAAQAYQRALGAGALAREVRDYAEARIRALN